MIAPTHHRCMERGCVKQPSPMTGRMRQMATQSGSKIGVTGGRPTGIGRGARFLGLLPMLVIIVPRW